MLVLMVMMTMLILMLTSLQGYLAAINIVGVDLKEREEKKVDSLKKE